MGWWEMNLPRFPLLSEKETEELLRRAREGDREARERLINCNLKLVFNLVKRFEGRGCDLEDLFQIGTLGLIKAIDKFDPSYQVRFSTYAVPMILGEIRRYLRDNNPVKVSRSLKETAFKVNRAREELTKKLGREPSLGELAEALGMPREEVVMALEAQQVPASLHDTIYQEEGDPICLMDQLEGEEGEWLDKLLVNQILERLPPRLRQVLIWRFFEDRTQAEIAQLLGISQVQVSRLERQALQKLREILGGKGAHDS